MNKTTSSFHVLSGLAVLAILCFAPNVESTDPIDPIAAGKEIYTKGTSPSGKDIFALMSGVKVPAAVLPCVNCHGSNGTGRPEGGVTPSNLQWDILTKENGGQFKSRREHKAYTDKSIKRAITMGLDPAGNDLLKTMPRYQLSQEDMAYLTAYLKVLGKESEKGVEQQQIKTGFVLPDKIKTPVKRAALQKVLEAYFAEINQKGGIYNRKFDAQFFEPDFIEQSKAEVETCFALGNCWDMKPEYKIADWATEMEMPVIGAVSNLPVKEGLDNKYVFFLYPGLLEQVQGQIQFLKNKGEFEKRNIVLIHDQRKDTQTLVESVQAIFEKSAIPKTSLTVLNQEATDWGKVIPDLKEQAINTIFYLGAPGLENDFFKMADDQAWYPDFLCLGTRSGIRSLEIPKAFDQRIYLAYPNWLDELSESGWGLYQSLKSKYKLSNKFQNEQISTLAAAIIYTEAVRNCGRKLTREKLINQLEKLYDYKTGLIPPVSYGLNNRIGSQKIYITSVDLERSTLKLETIIKNEP